MPFRLVRRAYFFGWEGLAEPNREAGLADSPGRAVDVAGLCADVLGFAPGFFGSISMLHVMRGMVRRGG